MATRRNTMGLALAGALLLAGCAGARFQTAAGRFGTETEKTMKAQSEQIEAVSTIETQRLREHIIADKRRLGLHEDCMDDEMDALGKFLHCRLISAKADSNEDEEVVFTYELPDILALQDALSAYGSNLALLADSAEADQAAFSKSVDKLGTSIGKLDTAISKAAKSPRLDPDGKIGTIASVIGTLGNLAFKFQRRAALRHIIAGNDPLIQEALQVLEAADREAARYKRLKATDFAVIATDKAKFASSDVDRRRLNEELYRAVDLLNAIEANTPKIRKLAGIHAALAVLAHTNSEGTRTALAKKMLEDWTRD